MFVNDGIFKKKSDGSDVFNSLTSVLKVNVEAIERVFQTVTRDLQLHYLLANCHVWFGDVDFHFWIADLIGKTVTHHFWQIPSTCKEKNISLLVKLLNWQSGWQFSKSVDPFGPGVWSNLNKKWYTELNGWCKIKKEFSLLNGKVKVYVKYVEVFVHGPRVKLIFHRC